MAALNTEIVGSIAAINENQWEHVVSQSALGTIFHTPGWLQAIEDGLEQEPRHIVVRKGNNPIALCPNFISPVDTPFDSPVDLSTVGLTQLASVSPGFGGPLVVTDTDESLKRMFAATRTITEDGPIVHRLRILDASHVRYAQRLSERGYVPSLLYCRFWLPLTDHQSARDGMDKERRKEIRDANDDVEVSRRDVNTETIREFYTEYEKTIDRVDGTLYPLSFFEALVANLDEQIELFTAYVDDDPVGSHLYLRDEMQDSMHYFFAGIDEQYFEYSPPAILHDHVIQWAIENGYASYDFGGTRSHYDDGTFKYKEKFGAKLEPVYEWEGSYSTVKWPLYEFARQKYIEKML